MKRSETVFYTIRIQKPGAGSGSFRAAFLTDLHNVSWDDDPGLLPALVEQSRPDLILCGGDMIIAHPDESVEKGLSFMKRMLSIAPVYFALGNHEYRSRIYPSTYGTMYRDFMDPLTAAGMTVLDNRSEELCVNGADITLYGLSVPRKKYRRLKRVSLSGQETDGLIGPVKTGRASVLLAHNPKFMDTYFDWGADLTLCGHYHGGIIGFGKHHGLISPGLLPFTGKARGRFDRGGRTVIVSAGLGEHTVRTRIHNPRELVILDILVNMPEP